MPMNALRMPVYHVGNFAPDLPNGVDRVIHDLGRLIERDVDYNVVSFTEADPDAYRREESGAVTIHRFGRPTALNFRLPGRFRRWFDALPPPAIVHLHSVFATQNYAVARECWRSRRPYVFTPHDSYVPRSMRTRWLLKRVYLRLFERRILDRAAAIQALTEEGRDCIAAQTTNPRIALIRNFIPDPDGDAPAWGERAGFLYVGRMDIFQKGLDRLIAAYGRLRRECPDAPPLTLVGPADGGQARRIAELLAQAGLTKGRDVRILGAVDEVEKRRLMAAHRWYVQLSRFEGFGLSVAEALARGVPVIVSPEIPLAGLVRTHGAGYVAGSAEQAVAALRSCLDLGAADYAAMARGASRLHREALSADSVRAGMLDLYEAVAASAGRIPGAAVPAFG